MSNNPNLIDENNIPENWEPVDASPVVPGRIPGGAAPPVPHDMPPYFSGSIAPALQHDSDFVATEVGSPRIPKISLMPFGNQANPSTNAAAQSTAKIIAEQVVAAIPPSTSGGGSSTTDTDLIAGVSRHVFGSVDSFGTTSLNTGNGGGNTLTSITIAGKSAGANEVAVVAAIGATNAGNAAGSNPGGWTTLPSGSGTGGYSLFPVAAGPLSVTQTLGASYNVCQALALFKTNGSSPVFTIRGGGSGGTVLNIAPFTPAAGNSLLFISAGGGGAIIPAGAVITDSVGNTWQAISVISAGSVTGGLPHGSFITIYYAQNVIAASTTLTFTVANGGTYGLWEISNLGNISSGAYTFQSSDNLNLVQFSGGANVTATLPAPAFAAGWQVQVSNNSQGNITLMSAALINNAVSPVVLGPGSSTWVFSDGTNYWTTTISTPSGLAKIPKQWLDSYSAFSGQFTQSEPAFGDISGNLAITQLNNGTNANSATFWRGDNTWSGLGGVNAQTTNYTAVLADANKIISFNSATPVTLTLPAAFFINWRVAVENTGTGVLTISHGSANIDGVAADVTLLQNQGLVIYSDGFSAWYTQRGANPSVGRVSVKAGNYTATAGDSGRLLAFNTTAGFVQGAKSDYSSRASIALPFASNNASGNMIVVLASNAGTNPAGITISDTRGNTYVPLFTDITMNGNVQAGWYALNVGAGANTVTVSWTGSLSSGLAIAEYLGPLTTLALDQSGKTTGSGNWASSSLTTTQAQEILVDFAVSAGAITATNAPFTQREPINSGVTFAELTDDIVTSIGTFQATGNASGNYVNFLATFKVSGTGGSMTLTLPAASPSPTWTVFVQNYGAGTVTISPNGLLLDGVTSNLTVAAGKGVTIFTDGTNYYTFRGGS